MREALGPDDVPLQFWIASQTNRSFGGGASFVGDYLSEQAPDFGPALREISMTIACNGTVTHHRGFPPLDEADSIRFDRKRTHLKIVWVSRRMAPDEALAVHLDNLTASQWRTFFADVADALHWALPKRMTREPGFDPNAFLAWLDGLGDGSPSSDAEGKALAKTYSEQQQARFRRQEAADPWRAVDVDWDRMHPEARTILDDPFDWRQGAEAAPHGNDTGADILADWRAHARLEPAAAGRRLGWRPEDEGCDLYRQDRPKIVLALAFGHIKHSGTCAPALARAAVEALETRRSEVARWPEAEARNEALEHFARYAAILTRFAAG